MWVLVIFGIGCFLLGLYLFQSSSVKMPNIKVIEVSSISLISISLIGLYIYWRWRRRFKFLNQMLLNFPDLKYGKGHYIPIEEFKSISLYQGLAIQLRGSDLFISSQWKASTVNVLSADPRKKTKLLWSASVILMLTDIDRKLDLIIKSKSAIDLLKVPSFLKPLFNPFLQTNSEQIFINKKEIDQVFDIYSVKGTRLITRSFLNNDRLQGILNLYYLLKDLQDKQLKRKKSSIFKSPINQDVLELTIREGRMCLIVKNNEIMDLAFEKVEVGGINYLMKILNEILMIAK